MSGKAPLSRLPHSLHSNRLFVAMSTQKSDNKEDLLPMSLDGGLLASVADPPRVLSGRGGEDETRPFQARNHQAEEVEAFRQGQEARELLWPQTVRPSSGGCVRRGTLLRQLSHLQVVFQEHLQCVWRFLSQGYLFSHLIPCRPAGVGSSDHLPEIDFCYHLWRRVQQRDLPRGRIQHRYLVDDSEWLLFPFLTPRCAQGHADHVRRQLLPEAHEHQAQGSGRGGNVQYRKGLVHCSPKAGSLEYVLVFPLMTRFPRAEERDHR